MPYNANIPPLEIIESRLDKFSRLNFLGSAAIFSGMDKDQIAEILVEIGMLLELKGENPFKTRAYANAARTH